VSLPPGQQHTDQGDDILRIVCLGEFRVFRGDVELRDSDWGRGRGPTRKIKALLAFLLCQRAQGARKETIIDLLWPEQTNSKRANSSFHQALFYLRRALEPDLEASTPSSYIRHRGERYCFAPQKPYWIDADAFVDWSERARSLEQSGDPASAIECWARATELYGGRYMDGIDSRYTDSEYYDWCASACYRFEQLFLAATLTVGRHHLDVGHHALAIVHAREALQVEPALESAHCLLIQCLMETGQLEHALGQYRVCEAELDFHHERVPSEQTRLLYQQLVDQI
jgi:DNA-binding SARP family transcriptional activator